MTYNEKCDDNNNLTNHEILKQNLRGCNRDTTTEREEHFWNRFCSLISKTVTLSNGQWYIDNEELTGIYLKNTFIQNTILLEKSKNIWHKHNLKGSMCSARDTLIINYTLISKFDSAIKYNLKSMEIKYICDKLKEGIYYINMRAVPGCVRIFLSQDDKDCFLFVEFFVGKLRFFYLQLLVDIIEKMYEEMNHKMQVCLITAPQAKWTSFVSNALNEFNIPYHFVSKRYISILNDIAQIIINRNSKQYVNALISIDSEDNFCCKVLSCRYFYNKLDVRQTIRFFNLYKQMTNKIFLVTIDISELSLNMREYVRVIGVINQIATKLVDIKCFITYNK